MAQTKTKQRGRRTTKAVRLNAGEAVAQSEELSHIVGRNVKRYSQWENRLAQNYHMI